MVIVSMPWALKGSPRYFENQQAADSSVDDCSEFMLYLPTEILAFIEIKPILAIFQN